MSVHQIFLNAVGRSMTPLVCIPNVVDCVYLFFPSTVPLQCGVAAVLHSIAVNCMAVCNYLVICYFVQLTDWFKCQSRFNIIDHVGFNCTSYLWSSFRILVVGIVTWSFYGECRINHLLLSQPFTVTYFYRHIVVSDCVHQLRYSR